MKPALEPLAMQPQRQEVLQKQERLLERLRAFGSAIVAFSGGTDSAYLAWAAKRALGDCALAVTAISPSFSAYDREQAGVFAKEQGLRHEWLETHEFDNPLYVANQPDRCYHCKAELFSRLQRLKSERGIEALTYGANVDDLRDFRPGHRAASEYGVQAPLLDAELTKSEIRALSLAAQLPTWDRPAAACLSSRVPYGTLVTIAGLSRIERAESVLRALGFRQFRVRSHEDLARIEIEKKELPRALEPEIAASLADGIRAAGFQFVTIDLEGYRQGSLNSAIRHRKRPARAVDADSDL